METHFGSILVVMDTSNGVLSFSGGLGCNNIFSYYFCFEQLGKFTYIPIQRFLLSALYVHNCYQRIFILLTTIIISVDGGVLGVGDVEGADNVPQMLPSAKPVRGDLLLGSRTWLGEGLREKVDYTCLYLAKILKISQCQR